MGFLGTILLVVIARRHDQVTADGLATEKHTMAFAALQTPPPHSQSLSPEGRGENRLFSFVLVLAAAVCAPAQARDGARQPLEFVAHTASGETVTGPLLELSEDGSVRLGGPKPRVVAAGDLISLRQRGHALPARPAGEQIVLANGDQIPGAIEGLTGETLRFRPALGGKTAWKLPLTALSLIWVAPPEGVRQPDRLRRRLAAGKRARDSVVLRNSDTLEGTLTGLEPGRLRLDANKREVVVTYERPADKVAVIALNTDLVRLPKPKGPYAHLVLSNGGRLAVTATRADAETLTARTLFGADFVVPLAEVVALDVYQGRAVYLSDLKPAGYEFTPYLSDRWPFVPDGSVAGRDLRLAGDTYDKGLGTHSACRLTYDLSAGYHRFEALVGLDAQSGREGQATIRVLVDGKSADLGSSAELVGGGKPLPVRVDVTGAKTLTLVVAFGRGGDVQDHVNWAEARLIR